MKYCSTLEQDLYETSYACLAVLRRGFLMVLYIVADSNSNGQGTSQSSRLPWWECSPVGAEPSGRLEQLGSGRFARSPNAVSQRDPVVVVGSGPAGLFAALKMAEAGLPVTLLERGQPVEGRGRWTGPTSVLCLPPPPGICITCMLHGVGACGVLPFQ